MPVSGTRLTDFAHGGGCGCKLAPSILRQLLDRVPARAYPDLLVGLATSDDAAVVRLNDSQALVATTDFFMPIVDDPYDFGRIAAANALSDVYAMGARPILALAILGVPVEQLGIDTIRRILDGGNAVCAAVDVPVAGGHSIDNPEPVYGLAAMGVVHPDRILKNSGARSGDALVLTKGLGIGIYGAALKRGLLQPEHYQQLMVSTTQLNTIGAELGTDPDVHAVTDVTGFGLLGHALELCRASNAAAVIWRDRIPFLPGVVALAIDGCATGAASRNWMSYGHDVYLPMAIEDWEQGLLCDPQTSGGLLISISKSAVPRLIERLRAAGFGRSSTIGEVIAGTPTVTVR